MRVGLDKGRHIARRLCKSREAKTLAANFIWLSLIKVAGLVTPLLVYPYLTRIIGPAYFGAIAFAASVIVFFETITDWGFNYTATRDIAQIRDNREEASRIYSEVITGKVLLMIASGIFLVLLVVLLPIFRPYKLVIFLTFLYIPGHILCQEYVFQAFEQMKFITVFSVISKIVSTLLVFVVITNPDDYVWFPLLIALGFISSGVVAQYVISHNLKLNYRFPQLRNVINRIKSSTNMFISLFLPNLYTNFTTLLLTWTNGETATGVYSGGQKVQGIIETITQTLSRTFFPFLVRHKDKHHIYVLISGSISIVACLVLWFGADFLTRLLLAPEFFESANVMRVFAITPFFLFLMNTYGTNYLVLINHERILRNIIVVCSLLGFIMTWLCTVRYSYIGAAATITFVWGVRGIITFFYAKKYQKLQ